MKINTKGKTEFERFNNVVRKILSVSHDEVQRRIKADARGKSAQKNSKSTKA